MAHEVHVRIACGSSVRDVWFSFPLTCAVTLIQHICTKHKNVHLFSGTL